MSKPDTRTRLRLPRPDRIPNASNERTVPELDTGGAFRPDWRMQSPSKDPKEPYGSESSGTGENHAWSNCTMTAAALAYAYARGDASGPWGGDFRHHQSDMDGGTDLHDADEAFHNYGNENLDVRIGLGWADLKAKRGEGRAIVIQGEGNVPGTESFDGGHACCIGLETNSDGKWLWGDPLASGWQWVTESSIRDWAENLSSGIYYACTKVAPMPPTTTPPPEGDTMRTFYVPLEPMLASVESGAWLYNNSGLDSDPANIQVSPGRDMPYVGKTSDAYIVAYVNSSGVRSDDAYWVKLADVSGTKPDPEAGGECPECPEPPDQTAEIEAAVAARDTEWVNGLTEVWPAGVMLSTLDD